MGLQLGSAENGASWTTFLRDLVARGLSGVQLVTSDAHEGLKGAIAAVLDGTQWQRCRTHFKGALAYLAAWDVHHANIHGRCEPTTGIAPFHRLVAQVMSVEPYRSARRVFWVVDNGSSHRGHQAATRLTDIWPIAQLVHLPVARILA